MQFEAGMRLIEDLGLGALGLSILGQGGVQMMAISGDLDRAIEVGRQAIADLQAMGETGFLSTSAGFLACVLAEAGRDDEAAAMAELCERSAGPDDFSSQALWRQARSRILAARGELDRAEVLAREAVGYTEPSDYLLAHADARMALGRVLAAAGRSAEAADEMRLAAAIYGEKGATVLVGQAEAALAGVTAAEPGGPAPPD